MHPDEQMADGEKTGINLFNLYTVLLSRFTQNTDKQTYLFAT